ncbi:uncharacterized protein LOC116181461 [Photinus pyralis]|uniref:uncharacterized protein LOC116181461 n=1 Tax=Photinus pyralis TaxID=7054 RepID=UPI001266EC39|nr:uncharacterized protein LOC116181461 [Photinus pyralis]XP_031357700.1 uncharacterized protein LOC116181461 [Photinus pyralis]
MLAILLTLAACLSAATSQVANVELIEQLEHRLDEETTQCIRSTDADPLEVDTLWHTRTYTESSTLKCYLQCMYLKLNYISESGNFASDTIVSSITNATASIVSGCVDQASGAVDGCDKVYQFSSCLTNNNQITIMQIL